MDNKTEYLTKQELERKLLLLNVSNAAWKLLDCFLIAAFSFGTGCALFGLYLILT